MSTALETEIIGKELELVDMVSAFEACFNGEPNQVQAACSVEGTSRLPQRSLISRWKPSHHLDWFSSYTMKSVFLIVSFLAIGLVVSSLILSF
jgi:hypothetical protein